MFLSSKKISAELLLVLAAPFPERVQRKLYLPSIATYLAPYLSGFLAENLLPEGNILSSSLVVLDGKLFARNLHLRSSSYLIRMAAAALTNTFAALLAEDLDHALPTGDDVVTAL